MPRDPPALLLLLPFVLSLWLSRVSLFYLFMAPTCILFIRIITLYNTFICVLVDNTVLYSYAGLYTICIFVCDAALIRVRMRLGTQMLYGVCIKNRLAHVRLDVVTPSVRPKAVFIAPFFFFTFFISFCFSFFNLFYTHSLQIHTLQSRLFFNCGRFSSGMP